MIDKQLSGNIYRFTKHEIEEGLGPSFAAGKFACHIENGTETGIMRIYLQMPTLRTEFHNSAHRAVQATKPMGYSSWQAHHRERILAAAPQPSRYNPWEVQGPLQVRSYSTPLYSQKQQLL